MTKVKHFLKVLQGKISYFLWLLFDFSKFSRINDKSIRKVLIINLGFIGDLLATTPLIEALAKKYGKVDVLIKPEMQEVFTLNPNIRKIIFYHDIFKLDLENIKIHNYDLAVIVWPASFKISTLCLKAGIPYRIGATQTGLIEGKGYFLTRKVRPSWRTKHKVQENLDITRLIGANLENPKVEFYINKKDEEFINNLLTKNKIKEFVVIHPGKRGKFYSEYFWPHENFAKVADYLAENGFDIVITGSKEETKIANEILNKVQNKNKSKVINLTGKLTLKQFGAILKKSKLLVSIDTAAVHLASAFNTKTVVLNVKYPEIWHPWMPKDKYKILKNPKAEEVIESAKFLLNKK